MRKVRKGIFTATVLLVAAAWAPTAAVGQQAGRLVPSRNLQPSVDARLVGDKQAAAPRTLRAGFVPSEFECVAGGGGANLNLDCDDPVIPNNEPDIEVDPTDPLHMVASSNDFDSCCDEFYTTFDGGKTWSTGEMSREDHLRIGSDPVTTFDPKHEVVLHVSINFKITPEGLLDDGDLAVSPSTDGGLTWKRPVVVAEGVGDEDDPLFILNDKPWMVTDVNPASPFYGRTYVTWTRFRFSHGNFVENPIFEVHSDDGGKTWSRPQEISGNNPAFCTFPISGPAGQCNLDQISVPTVAPDGTLFVAFINGQHEAAWESDFEFDSQYLVVRSTDGGVTFSPPVHVVDLEDGDRDYPINVVGRQTLTGYQVRVLPTGNIVADPRSGRLYIVFSDNRNGHRESDNPVTNTDVFIVTSRDGVHWSAPQVVSDAPGDQWFPWADVNPVNGHVGVLFHDRSIDPFGSLYATTLALGLPPGPFSSLIVSNRPSNPVESLFFRAGAPDCPRCATFHGDYINLDFGSDGAANMVWTDMRRFINVPGFRHGFTENIFYARLTSP